jgi:hypothetical protein
MMVRILPYIDNILVRLVILSSNKRRFKSLIALRIGLNKLDGQKA